MKVGVFLGSKLSELGGGYTFESEIFNSLIELAPYSSHQFALCSSEKESPFQFSPDGNFEFISLHRSLQERLKSKLYRQTKSIFSGNNHSKSRNLETTEEAILNPLISREVELLLYLNSLHNPVMDIPYITVLWDLAHRLQPYFPEVSSQGEWEIRENIYALKLRRAAAIITGTKVGQEEIQQCYQIPKERIKILPFSTPQFSLNATHSQNNSILSKYQIPENYLLYPAQFWPHKNHVGLLLAVKLIRDKYNLTFPVVFVGSDKGNRSYVEQVVNDLDLSQQVHFLGFIPQVDLISLYQHAFALTFLTFLGPDNLPPLEAFALGCPVIASEVSGAQEQLGDAALLVNPKEPEQIAKAIKQLWEDRNFRETLIKRGLTRASRWTTKDYIKGLFEILDDFASIRRCWSNTKPYPES